MRRMWSTVRGSGSRSRGNIDPSDENAPVEENVPQTNTGNRRNTVARRRRVARSSDFADLSPHIDQNLGPDKELKNFRVLPGDEVHVSTSVEEAARRDRTRGSWVSIVRIYRLIRSYDTTDIIHGYLRDIGFGDFLSIENLLNNDVQLCGALAACWWKTTHTFHFSFGELGFTPLDFTMLTGIAIGRGDTLPYDEQYQHFDRLANLLPHLDLQDGITSNLHIRCSYIKQTIHQLLQQHPAANHIEIARLFILYMMGNLFFTNASNTIPCGYVAAVAELSFDSTPIIYDWGTPILAYLYRSLDHQCVVRSRSSSITGFWEILQYWYYEYFRNMTYPTVDPTLSLFFPRVRAWALDNLRYGQGGQARHVFAVARNQIELRTTRESVVWHPYDGSPYVTDPVVDHASFLSGRRFPLVSCPPSLGCYWFLGERSWRQIFDGDFVPDDPHPDTPYLRVYDSASLEQNAGEWWSANYFIITHMDYASFWHRFYTHPHTATFVHAASVDFVGPSALRSGVAPPVFEDLSQSTQVYHPPQPTQTGDYGWTVAIPTTSGGDRYVDIPRPAVNQYPNPAEFSYEDLFQMQMGLRQVMYVEHRRSIDDLTARINELTTADEQRYRHRSRVYEDNDYHQDEDAVGLFDDSYQYDEP